MLGDGFVGAYFIGSVALGGYVPGESDIDIAALCRRELNAEAKHAVVAAVEAVFDLCPARGLEFTLYREQVAAAAAVAADFEVNVNGGPRMDRAVHLVAGDELPFWYILDRGIAHRAGVTIVGPPAADGFADVDRSTLLRAMTESMRWHREHERATLYSVLNAARAWRFADTDQLGSKLDGAAWAADRWPKPQLINAAIERRHGRPAHLDADDVDELLDHVQQVLATSQ